MKVFQKIKGQLLKPFRPKHISFKNVFFRDLNLLILLNEDIGWRIFAKNEYEDSEFKVVGELIHDNYTCVDVGGNIGIYSLYMARQAINGKVYCFEPIPLYNHIISTNAALNAIDNIYLKQIALSDTIGYINFSICEDGAYSSIHPTGRNRVLRKMNLETSTLDHLFYQKSLKIDFLKIDVEGAELSVLIGGKKLLGDHSLKPRSILVELNEKNQNAYGVKPNDIIDYLEQHHYDCYSILPSGIAKGWPKENASEDVLFLYKTTMH